MLFSSRSFVLHSSHFKKMVHFWSLCRLIGALLSCNFTANVSHHSNFETKKKLEFLIEELLEILKGLTEAYCRFYIY